MNSTKLAVNNWTTQFVWEICKFWILQNKVDGEMNITTVWEICKFWILQNDYSKEQVKGGVWEICKFWILQNDQEVCYKNLAMFERYVNFEFYKTKASVRRILFCLRDM